MSSSPAKNHKRKKIVQECPNPLFLKWLTEWRDEAAKRGQKVKFVYEKALSSMKKYPLPLTSGRDAKVIRYCGEKICQMLDDKLAKYQAEHCQNKTVPDDDHLQSDVASTSNDKVVNHVDFGLEELKTSDVGKAKKNSSRIYIPVRKSGAYAILLALRELRQVGNIKANKEMIITAAQPLSVKSFSVPDPGSFYTAWSSMATLIKKGLVVKTSSPAKYSLTDTGLDLAIQISNAEKQTNNGLVAPLSDAKEKETMSGQQRLPSSIVGNIAFTHPELHADCNVENALGTSHFNDFTLYPGDFDIVLCVDYCETVSGTQNERKLLIQTELRKNGVNFDVRKLHVGDFVWVARQKVLPRPGQLHLPPAKELVLDYIVERKRKDDLASSIMDGRFREQKFRMKQSGLRRPIYLVEECGAKCHLSIPESHLNQAITNTQVIDGFMIKETNDQSESVAYLTIMTRFLHKIYLQKILRSCAKEMIVNTLESDQNNYVMSLMEFEAFNKNSMKMKPLSVTELFLKQLIQVSGMSVEKAMAIIELYPTPSSLFKRYNQCTNEKENELLLAPIPCGKSQRKLGPVLGKILYRLYTWPLLK